MPLATRRRRRQGASTASTSRCTSNVCAYMVVQKIAAHHHADVWMKRDSGLYKQRHYSISIFHDAKEGQRPYVPGCARKGEACGPGD
jgi:hypothetical protein